MIQVHFLADGGVELISHHLFSQMPTELCIARHSRKITCSHTLISYRHFIRNPEREGWVLIKLELVQVIVIDNHQSIYPLLLQPATHRVIRIKEWFPIRPVLIIIVESKCNRWRMR